jgi:hypothetical protein
MRSSILVALLILTAASVAKAEDDRYLLLATERTSTMQQEINEAAARGFRVVAASPKASSELVVLLEQTEDKYEYLLLATTRPGTLQREIGDAADAGYHIVPRAVTGKGDGRRKSTSRGVSGAVHRANQHAAEGNQPGRSQRLPADRARRPRRVRRDPRASGALAMR